MIQIVECVPNFSEGRRPEVRDQIVAAMAQVAGVRVLQVQSDPDHNRSVVTLIGPPESVVEAAFRGIAQAAALIDMNRHQGAHPRIGATDVVPLIPLRGVDMSDCVALARRLGERVGTELGIPVYLYEAAAARPERRDLAEIRRGEYERLKEEIATHPDRFPDFGPAVLGPAGATVIGARQPLIAWNVYLNSSDLRTAKAIARAVRHSGGGLRFVKAMGLLVRGQAQVSMNLTDYHQTPIHRVMELIRREAAYYGLSVTHTEIVGLVPVEALVQAAQFYLQLSDFSPDQILENWLWENGSIGREAPDADHD
ncbi:MAG: glutamate formimidoyltransferase [Anaerolineae bacterium]